MVFFTLYLYYIFVVSDFQRNAVFSFSGYLSRLRMQSYNFFLKHQIICNKKFQLFFFCLIISNIIFQLFLKYMLYNIFLCVFIIFLGIFRHKKILLFGRIFRVFMIFLCFFSIYQPTNSNKLHSSKGQF